MSARSWGPADGPLGPRDQALRDCAAARFSGALHVIGAPGGMITFPAASRNSAMPVCGEGPKIVSWFCA